MTGPPDLTTTGAPTPTVVSFTGPRTVAVVQEARQPLSAGTVRVRTLVSGISAGTELTTYRGSNPYLTRTWDAERRLFTSGAQSVDFPVSGWGYSEVGQVVEVADDVRGGPAAGDVVYGVWGHRSEAVLPSTALVGRRLPTGADPLSGVFARVGAIALNAVLAADVHLGEVVAVFGQGVLGLLATRLATLSGARVVGVDALAPRLELAGRWGAERVVDASAGPAAEEVKGFAPGGADVAIEISGSYQALHEATRSVCVGGRVVAAGFYQGEGTGLRLGEEFHHNRVQVVASQIGEVPANLVGRWTTERLHQVFMALVAGGQVDVEPLVSHVVPVAQAADAYRLLDEEPARTLQVVLDFREDAEAWSRTEGQS